MRVTWDGCWPGEDVRMTQRLLTVLTYLSYITAIGPAEGRIYCEAS